MRYPFGRILIFAKAPHPGQVKTRLIPALGAAAATRLQVEMTDMTVRKIAHSALAPVQLWCAPGPDHPLFDTLRTQYGVTLHTQAGGDLGERMANALSAALADSRFAIALGTDWPLMDGGVVSEVCAALMDGIDAAVVPAEDGGYVLLGLRRYDERIFTGIEWGGSDVMARTRLHLDALTWRWKEWPPAWDLDRIEDLRRAQAAGFFSWLAPMQNSSP